MKCIYLFEKIVCFSSPRAKPPPLIASYSLVVALVNCGQKGNLSISQLMTKSELVHNFFTANSYGYTVLLFKRFIQKG